MAPLILLTLGLLAGTFAAPYPQSSALLEPSCTNGLDNGKTFIADDARSFEIVCGKDFGGNDIKATNEVSFQACINKCSATTDCVNVAYVWGSCYLKSKNGDTSDVEHVWSAKLQTSEAPVEEHVELTCVDNKDNGRDFTTPKGTYHIQCGTDFTGDDIGAAQVPNFEACLTACSETTGCSTVSFVYGSCYMKSTKGNAVALAHVWGASLVTTTPEASTLTCVNQKDDAKVYNSPSGGAYLISCAIDYEGGDYSSSVLSNFEACITACDNEAQCIDLSYVEGSCYLKNVQTAALVKSHVWSAKRVTSGGNTSSSTTSSPVTTTVSSSSSIGAPTPTLIPAACVKKSPLPNSVCGTTGYTQTNARVILERTEAEYVTPEGCALLCSETATCAWYMLGKDTPTSPTVCMLESGTPNDGMFYGVPGVSYSAWSLDCFICTSASSATPSSTATTSSTLSTTTTTTSPTPVPTINVVPNGGFENTDTVEWIPSSGYVCNLCPTHNFRAKTDPNTGVVPHGGSQMAAVSLKLDAGNYFGNFETRINTPPNTSYRLSAWSWIPLDGAFCQVRYYFQPLVPDQVNNPYQSVNVADSTVAANRGVWKEATYTFTSGTGGVRALIVQISCNGASNAARMIYVDDVSLAVV